MSEEKLNISSEQIFDMLPFVVDIYEKIDFDKHRKDLTKKYKGKKNIDYLEPAIDGAKIILKNSGKIKEEFFQVVAIAENKDPDEIKKQSFLKTLKTVKSIFSDPELVAFFKEAM